VKCDRWYLLSHSIRALLILFPAPESCRNPAVETGYMLLVHEFLRTRSFRFLCSLFDDTVLDHSISRTILVARTALVLL
jgi:hypothetical protein